MQARDMAEKRRVLWDGVEIPGLVKIAEITIEEDTIEIPEFTRQRLIKSGVKKIPAVDFTYKLQRDTNTREFFNKFADNNEVKEATVLRTDAHGVEFEAQLWPGCEIAKHTIPETDLAAPAYAQCVVTVIPWDIIRLNE